MNMPIAQYFMLPELGLAIGLRPGDHLLFNPLFYHCISTKDYTAYRKKLYVASYYLKTAVVGGNDNSIPIEKHFVHKHDLHKK